MQKNKLYKLKEKYNNKTKAVIVGNGPSISTIDWDKIQNSSAREEVLFLSCNRISILFDKTSWRPDIYSCLTSASLTEERWRKSIDRCLEDERITSFVFKEFKNRTKIKEPHEDIFFLKNVMEHYRHSPIDKGFINVSLHTGVLKSYSATVPLFQICDFLGIQTLGVIGQDGYIFESGKNHFDDSYGFEASNFDKTNKRIMSVHTELKRYFNIKGVTVYNLSDRSILKSLYPKKDIFNFIKT
mgnify:CR=1 FL=1|tara:strand:+ start:274 stop:999 length:726 start_codon:yes stop_codon:yes gene_type:complete